MFTNQIRFTSFSLAAFLACQILLPRHAIIGECASAEEAPKKSQNASQPSSNAVNHTVNSLALNPDSPAKIDPTAKEGADGQHLLDTDKRTATSPEEADHQAPINHESLTKQSATRSTTMVDGDERSDDERAIRAIRRAYVQSFCAADATAVAGYFAADAEYIDEQGNSYQGRTEIEEMLVSRFKEMDACELILSTDRIRIVHATVAIEDGLTSFTPAAAEGINDGGYLESVYTAIYVKDNGKWLIASVREQPSPETHPHRSHLSQLAWLQGDWVDENEHSIVLFSCQPATGGNFLIRKFAIQIRGEEAMNGTQRIGWDPLTGRLKAWIFDSEGGHSDGFWHRDGERWVLKMSGVTADGRPASGTSVYTIIGHDTMTWQMQDYEVAGVQHPDSELVTIVRRAPAPQVAEQNSGDE